MTDAQLVADAIRDAGSMIGGAILVSVFMFVLFLGLFGGGR